MIRQVLIFLIACNIHILLLGLLCILCTPPGIITVYYPLA